MTGPVSPARAVADTTVALAAVKDVRRRTGATVNDLFLAAVADALRGYLDPLPDVVLALVPRNIRTESESGAIGNRAWSMLVPLPTGNDDPDERMAAIREATEAGKAMDSTSGTQGWRFDIALTNVPLGGPFAVLGRPVTHIRASVPLQGQNRLVGVLLSYDDMLTVSYTADGSVYPDVERLAELTRQSWQRMLAASSA
jgi:diacylglycerol O-acyltransferase